MNFKRFQKCFCVLACIVCIILVPFCNGKDSNLHVLTQKTRAAMKRWVYKVWVQKDNLFEVVPGQLYRSSQLPPDRLEKCIKRYNIKTIVNLSGQEPYYWVSNAEQRIAQKHGVVLFNMKTHAMISTPLEQIRSLIAISLGAPLPILFHCFAGSDRTGEACALHILATSGDVIKASGQLTSFYGHKRWLFPKKIRLIKNFDTLYPCLIEEIARLCPSRFAFKDLPYAQGYDLYDAIVSAVEEAGENGREILR